MILFIPPLIALIAGILILIRPHLLSYIVAIYLIIMGVIGLFFAGVSVHMQYSSNVSLDTIHKVHKHIEENQIRQERR